MTDTNPGYWEDYSNLQQVKHRLIQEYLKGWFPILGSWSGRIIYFDTHAGRGQHATGERGSPIVALETFLDHNHREKILRRCEVVFYFIELDDANLAELRERVEKLGKLPDRLVVITKVGNCYEILQGVVEKLRGEGQNLAPALIFVDPYGFKIPGTILRDLMAFQKVELVVNVMWRELDMQITNAKTGLGTETINEIFPDINWSSKINESSSEGRVDDVARLYCELTNAAWPTYIRMFDNNRTRYFLLHLSNHRKGRRLMKDCMWKVCPDATDTGQFFARKFEEDTQLALTFKPDLSPLKSWVLKQLCGGPLEYSQIECALLSELWRETHLKEMIRSLRESGEIKADGYGSRFAFSNNPRLSLPG